MTWTRALAALFLTCFLARLSPLSAAPIDPALLAGMKARAIGPAAMSGRVAAVEGVPSDPDQLWIGAATGGVWKSTDGGLTFTPVFDDQPVSSIGAIAVSPSNPSIVWVGTGEGNPRNSVSVGNGVYRSNDGGRTWKHLGLEATERIHRILLHPENPDVAWVAALGRAWGENPERGVFKTIDGGKSWQKVLYVDEKTGAADLTMSPDNPQKLFAAMWEYRRWPWFFRSGGPGSGLYVTHDGGATWRRASVEDGMPAGDLGRIGVAVSRSDPRVVYALVEAEESAMLRSGDGGRTWKKVNSKRDVSPRPFYYADLRVDPENANRVYRLASALDVSDDGGRNWEALLGWGRVHPDHHALWIHPEDGSFMVNGNDGGVAVTHDRGINWRYVGNLPLAQFYHVRVDQDFPYNVYGGLQDNGSWKGPSAVWENGGIRNQHWQEVGWGDGFDTVPDPRDPLRGYAMSQEGYLVRWDLRTGERKDLRPAAAGVPLRFNWNAGIAVDPFAPDTIYYGSQFVHQSTDRGDTWTTISPDLTTNRKEWQRQRESGGLTPDVTGAENFTTILSIAPSPLERGLIWVGTDDGRLHVTRDGGANWTSVEKNVRGVPENTWIPHVVPSPHDAGTAFAVFDDHRRSNWTPYVYRTTDYGRTWTSLATRDLRGYALAIAQDPVDPDLLFLGTEFGLWVSLDGGRSWLPWRHGVPTVSVMDLAVHPRDHDLVVATHGRALYVLDDLAPLRTLSAETLRAPLHLFPGSRAVQHRVRQTGSSRFPGHAEYVGENEPYGAVLTYSLNVPGLPHPDVEVAGRKKEEERQQELARRRREERPPEAGEEVPAAAVKGPPAAGAGEEAAEPPAGKPGEGPQVTIEVRDGTGALLRSFKGPAKLGLNRAVWDLAVDAPKSPSETPSWWGGGGPEVLPGTYRVKVRYQEHEADGQVEVLPDPRVPYAAETRRANWQAQRRATRLQDTATAAVERVRRTRADLGTLLARARPEEKEEAGPEAKAKHEAHRELAKEAGRLEKELDKLEARLWQPPDVRGIPPPDDALTQIQYAQMAVASSWDAPTAAQAAYLAQAEATLRAVLADLQGFLAKDVAEFRKRLQETDMRLLPELPPLEIEPE